MVSVASRLTAAGALLCASAASAAPAPCDGLLATQAETRATRALDPIDLVRLRDIGPVDPSSSYDARRFTLSPDGSRVAFQLRRADPATNRYCLAMVVLELRPGALPQIVDTGGEFMRISFENRGRANYPTGMARVITPRWSPDGRWIYFLKKQGGQVRVWRAGIDETAVEMVTRSGTDIEDFTLTSTDGVIFSTRPALDAAMRKIEAEARAGFHFDARFAPALTSRPFAAGPLPRLVQVQELASGAIRPATDAETALLPGSPTAEVAWGEAIAKDGRHARLEVPSATFSPARGRLTADDRSGRRIACAQTECAEVSRLWWTSAGRVRYFRREGWADASTAIYEWEPGPAAPRRLYVTDDVLVDCTPEGDALLCLREASLVPRRLERLDPATGRRELVFDPNPEFTRLQLGKAERLRYRNAFGLETVADLVLPAGHQPGVRVPLVVVQYDTRGFLRGGTGDDYPIQAFANRGYAVLSVSRPRMIGMRQGSADVAALERRNLDGFAQRRSILSSIETGVRLAIDRGIADPRRLGLTGMSDGSTIANWAALHSNLFSAMAISQCCFDESFLARVGPGSVKLFRDIGYPGITDKADAFWDKLSLVRNARRMRTPTLIQVADDEVMGSLPTWTALREVGAPVDMFVFPGEHHLKWQPAHRLSIYRRALDWFDFWLRDRRSPDPGRQAEIRHWTTLRSALANRAANQVVNP